MSKKTVAEWISIILCLLPSPFVIMVLLTLSGQMRDTWHISLALAITIYAIIVNSFVYDLLATRKTCLFHY